MAGTDPTEPTDVAAESLPDSVASHTDELTTTSVAEAEYEQHLKPLSVGDIVKGQVVAVDNHGVFVDVGTKSEGFIPPSELEAGGDGLSVGDQIDVYVIQPHSAEGHVLLSKRKADYEKVWDRLVDAHKTQSTTSAMVIERVKGGLVVDLGMRGFLPASQVAVKHIGALDRMVGQSIKLKVLELDPNRKRVVVSQKKALEEDRKTQRETLVSSLAEGQIRKGVVRRLVDYGAFVDLGGLDGLLHVTEIDWARVGHPKEVLKTGQKIEVLILKMDPGRGRVSLSRKQIMPDPWQHIGDHHTVGQVVQGTVTRVVPAGAFVRLPSGIEGFVPTRELSTETVRKPADAVPVGKEITVRVMQIRPTERRMSLSVRQTVHSEREATPKKDTKEFVKERRNNDDNRRITLGDLVGDALQRGLRRTETVAPAAEVAADEAVTADTAGDPASSSSESPAE